MFCKTDLPGLCMFSDFGVPENYFFFALCHYQINYVKSFSKNSILSQSYCYVIAHIHFWNFIFSFFSFELFYLSLLPAFLLFLLSTDYKNQQMVNHMATPSLHPSLFLYFWCNNHPLMTVSGCAVCKTTAQLPVARLLTIHLLMAKN